MSNRTDEIRARCEAATPGPWKAHILDDDFAGIWIRDEVNRLTVERGEIMDAFESIGHFGGELTGLCEYCGDNCISAGMDEEDEKTFQCGCFRCKWRGPQGAGGEGSKE